MGFSPLRLCPARCAEIVCVSITFTSCHVHVHKGWEGLIACAHYRMFMNRLRSRRQASGDESAAPDIFQRIDALHRFVVLTYIGTLQHRFLACSALGQICKRQHRSFSWAATSCASETNFAASFSRLTRVHRNRVALHIRCFQDSQEVEQALHWREGASRPAFPR